jgi:hypothetical protein
MSDTIELNLRINDQESMYTLDRVVEKIDEIKAASSDIQLPGSEY